MNASSLLESLVSRGVEVAIDANDITLRSPASVLTDADVEALRDAKADIVRLLRLADGLPIDDDMARLMTMDQVAPDDVPACTDCGQLCDVQSLEDSWHCTACDPRAEARRQYTTRLQRTVAKIRVRSAQSH